MKTFEDYLLAQEYASNTIASYLFAAKQLEQNATPIMNWLRSFDTNERWLAKAHA